MAALGSRYELFELIGQGTSGAVHRARDLVLGREIAIKVLSASAGVQADAPARAVPEAQVAARFAHPSPCAVSAAGGGLGRELAVGVVVHTVDDGDSLVPAACIGRGGRSLGGGLV